MDWHLLIEVATAILAVTGFVYAAGKFVGRIEIAAKRVETIEARLERIPAIEQHLLLQDARLDRIEHRTNSAHAHAMRAEFATGGDYGKGQ
jgi:hypothetical protein